MDKMMDYESSCIMTSFCNCTLNSLFSTAETVTFSYYDICCWLLWNCQSRVLSGLHISSRCTSSLSKAQHWWISVNLIETKRPFWKSWVVIERIFVGLCREKQKKMSLTHWRINEYTFKGAQSHKEIYTLFTFRFFFCPFLFYQYKMSNFFIFNPPVFSSVSCLKTTCLRCRISEISLMLML